MKQKTLKILALAAALLGATGSAKAACEVITDSYGKTKVVWDFTVISEKQSTAGDYYLNASTNEYVTSGYPSSAPTTSNTAAYIAKINIYGRDDRCILPAGSPDSDKGAGVLLGIDGSTWQGYIEFYAPISGKITVEGKYAGRITIIDKSDSDNKLYTGSGVGSGSTSITSTSAATRGHRYQLYAAGGGMGVAKITISADDYDTDVVDSGDMNFSDATNSIYGVNVDIYNSTTGGSTQYYQLSNKGYKSSASTTSPTDCLILNPTATNTVVVNPTNEAYGLKVRNGGSLNYTTTKSGYLTISFNYGANLGTWYIKNSSGTNLATLTNVTTIYLGPNQRAQYVAPTGTSNVAALFTNITFTEASASIAIGSTGWATLYSEHPLNFSDVSGLTAYTATCDGNTVTLTQVSDVPANTGVVLKGTANTNYTIPVIVKSTTEQGALTGSTSALAYSSFESGYNYYVLIPVNEGSQVQFNPVTSGTIAACKAYLKIASGGSGVKALSVVFNEQTTDINAVGQTNAAQTDDGIVYTLSGQRAKAVTKGIFIKNGRKFIAK